jgi:hypothetical protein
VFEAPAVEPIFLTQERASFAPAKFDSGFIGPVERTIFYGSRLKTITKLFTEYALHKGEPAC